MPGPVYIVGVGLTKVSRHFDKSLIDLFAEASLKALEEAGVEPRDLDAVVVGNMLANSLGSQDSLGALLATSIGARYKAAFHVKAACGSGGVAVYTGYSLVASGLADLVLVGGVEKMTDYPTPVITTALAQAGEAEYEVFYGASFAAFNALMMRLYMEKYGVSRDEMSEWPVMMHANAEKNPYAQIRRRISREDVAKSRVVADPIRLLDSSPIGDGAAAVLLASENGLKKLGKKPDVLVEIAGVGLAVDTVELSNREELDAIPALRYAALQAYNMAGIEPKKLDVVEVHDAFTITGILSLEALGLAEKGKAAKLVAEGRFHPGDKPVANPSGGLKARGHPVGATGVYQVAEITMQLRGDFPGVKVEGAEYGLASNIGGDGSTITAIVLRRVR